MNLPDIPENLICTVSSFLDYSDNCSFMESSKLICNKIKRNDMDKMRLDSITFKRDSFYDDDFKIFFEFSYEAENGKKAYTLKKFKETGKYVDGIKQILSECAHIQQVNNEKIRLDIELAQLLIANRAKIGYVAFLGGCVFFAATTLEPDEFLNFCKIFKGSKFLDYRLHDYMCNDEFLIEVVPYTVLEITDRLSIGHTAITDKMLSSLIGKKGIQSKISLKNVSHHITIQGIVNILQVLQDCRPEYIEWHLGLLYNHQFENAEHYFNEEFGVLRSVYEITVNIRGQYKDYKLVQNDENRNYTIAFTVSLIPNDHILPGEPDFDERNFDLEDNLL